MLSVRRIARSSTAALGAAVLCAVTVLFATPAGAQTPTNDVQSVGMAPTESKPDDPNAGQWFVFSIAAGGSATTKARITNPASVPQVVKLYLSDLVFGADGTPTIPDRKPEEVGAWGRFEQATVTVPPRGDVLVPILLNVPANAEPGDHVGAAVAESQPIGDTVKIIKRIATRLYITVPGEATKSFTVVNVRRKLSSMWFPKDIEVTTLVRNTGRVRLHPVVSVGKTKAAGADPLLARSVETYVAKVPVPWYGGPVKVSVDVKTDAGTKQVPSSMFVIPWGNLALMPVGVALLFALRGLWRLRTRKMRGLQADLRRLEKLVAEKQTGAGAAKAALAQHGAAAGGTSGDGESDPEAERIRSIRAGIKRARRNGAQEPLERLSLALHDTGEDALAELVAALDNASDATRPALVTAAASYGRDRLVALGSTLPAVLQALVDVAPDASSPATKRPVRAKSVRDVAGAKDRAESGAGTAPDSARTPPKSGAARAAKDAGAPKRPAKKQPAGTGRGTPRS